MQERAINLTFHGIGPCGRSLEPGEDGVWLSDLRLAAVLDAVADRADVRIMFDDGNASDVQLALPALRRRDLRGTFFVVAGRVGEPGFLDEHGVRALADAGMTIGLHGMRHRRWHALDDRTLHEELVDARAVLEDIVGRPVTRAACPYGAYDRRVLRTLRSCGYRHVYTSDRGTARAHDWLQARNTIGPCDGVGVVEDILALERRSRDVLRRRARLAAKRWR